MIQACKNLIDALLSLVLPKDAFVLAIERMPPEDLAEKIPPAGHLENEKYRALFAYKDPMARKAIWEIKYKGNRTIAAKFSRLLHECMLESIADAALFGNFSHPLVVPIPASRQTLRERGFNQCELIAGEIAKIDGGTNFEIALGALVKIKDTPHQSKLKNRAERLENLRDSFGAHGTVKGRNVIVVDDVITTGATMREATKTLRKAGAKNVLCFALAH